MVKFADVQDKIKDRLGKIKESLLNEDGFILLEGFVYYVIADEIPCLSSDKSFPMVVLVGEKSGRVYTFALSSILPELPIFD